MGGYLAEPFYVTSKSARDILVRKEVGFTGKTGRIFNDGGTIFVQVAEEDGGAIAQDKLTVHSGEVLVFERADDWTIGHMLISTDSATALSGRLVLKP